MTGKVLVSWRVVAAVALAGMVILGWAGVVTSYILFRDEVAQHFFAQQTELKFTYEDRIADISARLSREVTLGMVERTGFESRASALLAKQAEIEARQARLQSLAERAGGIRTVMPGSLAGSRPLATARIERPDEALSGKPAPLTDPSSFRMRDGSGETATSAPEPRDRLSLLADRLRSMQAEELSGAKTLAGQFRARVSRLRAALAATGLDIERRGSAGGMGGPLVPWTPPQDGSEVSLVTATLEMDLAEIDHLQSRARTLPLGRPVLGELEETSPFGYRVDPFTRGPALHTGVDLRIEYGGPVRTTGAGRVSVAEFSGGYGNLVEIDHGGGVATRYGHLSAFEIAPGDRVEAGQVIGRAGSTGRSTGFHVHYETRVNGEPVNPTRFLQAGQLLDQPG